MTDTGSTIFDVLILGAGPAGLAAGIYAGRAKLSALIIDKGMDGGQIALTHNIENYPGQEKTDGESGLELITPMVRQYRKFGCERVIDTVLECSLDGDVKTVKGSKGTYLGRSVIICTGAMTRQLGIADEDKYIGKGLSYCAVCDARFFQDMDIYAVGGNSAALEEALYLSKFAKKLTVIFKAGKLSASDELIKEAENAPNIEFMPHSEVVSLSGDAFLNKMTVRNTVSGDETEIVADENDGSFGLFVFTGKKTTGIFDNQVKTEGGFIVTNEKMETGIPGVYAAGDVRVTPLRQVVTACSDGAIAANECVKYLRKTGI